MKRISPTKPLLKGAFLAVVICACPLHPVAAAPNSAAATEISSGAAQGSSPATRPATVTEVAKELICTCPDCGHQSLDQCGKCAIGRKFRAIIAAQLKEGKSKGQIINYFGDHYGEEMLGNPRARGFNRSAVMFPALAVAFGLVPLGLMLGARRRKNTGTPMRLNNSSEATGASGKAIPPAPDDPRVAAALRDLDF